MTLEEYRLTLNPDGTARSYDISMVQRVGSEQSKPATTVTPPSLPPYDSLFYGVQGMSNDIPIAWQIYDDGTDKSNGTAPIDAVTGKDSQGNDLTYQFNGSVVTLTDQKKYLKHVIHESGFGARWELDHLTGDQFQGNEVYLESVDFAMEDRQSPRWQEATMRLRVGRGIA
jgi:hypothetical protein